MDRQRPMQKVRADRLDRATLKMSVARLAKRSVSLAEDKKQTAAHQRQRRIHSVLGIHSRHQPAGILQSFA